MTNDKKNVNDKMTKKTIVHKSSLAVARLFFNFEKILALLTSHIKKDYPNP